MVGHSILLSDLVFFSFFYSFVLVLFSISVSVAISSILVGVSENANACIMGYVRFIIHVSTITKL